MIEQLTEEQRAILAARLAGRSRDRVPTYVAGSEEQRSYPLSPSQEGMWYLYSLDRASPLYNLSRAHRFSGALDVAALQRALDAIVARHAPLRMRFQEQGDVLRQVVEPPSPVALTVEDFEGLPSEQREDALTRRLTEVASSPFDLAAQPPFRARLFRLSGSEHVLLLDVHHIVSDEWSNQLLLTELSTGYARALASEDVSVPRLRAQFGDHAARQRQRAESPEVEEQLAWWETQLAGVVPVEVPVDRPRGAVRATAGAVHEFRLPPALRAGCERLASECRVTAFAVLLASFTALLQRHTDLDDIVVGSPTSGRTESELEELIGLFVATLAIRVDLSDAPSFRSLVDRAARAATDAMAYQAAPFDRVVQRAGVSRDASRPALTQVMLAFQNTPRASVAFPGLTTVSREVDNGTAKFDITCFVYDEGEHGYRCRLEYATALYDETTARRLATQWETLLGSALREPDRPVRTLSMVRASECEQLLHALGGTRVARPEPSTIPALFAARVHERPDSIAVEHGDVVLTYRDVELRADELSARLVAAGVRRGDRVALLMERGVPLIVSMLATSFAGAAYVPLDASHPAARLDATLKDARPTVLLTSRPLPEDLSVTIPVLSPEPAAKARPASVSGDVSVGPRSRGITHPGDAAYVMYTSGSTGVPKGVIVSHSAISNLVRGSDLAPIGPQDVVAHASNTAFDASVWELWGALLNGARLTVLDQAVVLDPPAYAREIRARGVTAAFLTTSLFNVIAHEVPTAFACLQCMVFGGESADPKSVRLVARHGAPGRLLNAYGPTEATVFSTWYSCADLSEDAHAVPIGRPIPGARVYVLDAHGALVPVGVPGELHIGGAGVAQGYLDRAELTAARFVPDPFVGADATMYRTGDLVRWRPDGELEFLGRRDRQVKLRGLRIELEEIEGMLDSHPSVTRSVVDVQGIGSAQRLAAYVVGQPGNRPTAELLDQLRSRLPSFMVPASVTWLDAMPLTRNGKVDRDALPTPDEPMGMTIAMPPRDSLEKRLAALWEELLGVRQIGIRDDFFDLGGHSLLAVRMMSQVEALSGRRIPLAALIAGATIERLATLLRVDLADQQASGCVVLNDSGRMPTLFMFHGDVFGEGLYGIALARHLGEEQPLALLPPLAADASGNGPDFPEMARRQLATIRRIQPAGPYRLAGYCNGALVAYEVARVLERVGEQVEQLLIISSSAENANFALPLRFAKRKIDLLGRGAHLHDDRMTNAHERIRDFHRDLQRGLGDRSLPGRVVGTAGFVAQRLVRGILLRIHYMRHPLPPAPEAPARLPDADSLATEDFARREAHLLHLLRTTRAYVPGRYRGRVTLLSHSASLQTPWDPASGWRKAARTVDLVEIAGDHDTCVTTHLEDLAARMSDVLQRGSPAR